jgi:hypothetical protein
LNRLKFVDVAKNMPSKYPRSVGVCIWHSKADLVAWGHLLLRASKTENLTLPEQFISVSWWGCERNWLWSSLAEMKWNFSRCKHQITMMTGSDERNRGKSCDFVCNLLMKSRMDAVDRRNYFDSIIVFHKSTISSRRQESFSDLMMQFFIIHITF